MALLVTGGAGFIGSAFINYSLRTHPERRIICYDLLTYAADRENIDCEMDNDCFRFVKGDICDAVSLDAVFSEEKIDAVVNFAAETHVDRSIDAPYPFLRTNFIGVGVLLDACIKHSVNRFHQIGTDEVYGSLDQGNNVIPFDESAHLNPRNPYSASKASADLLAISYYNTYGLEVTVTRSCNNYGPKQYPEKLIPLAISHLMAGKKIPIYGNGLNKREWIWVEDNCCAIDLVLEKGKAGEVYNVGTGYEITNLELARMICRLIGVSEASVEFVPDRKGHDLRYLMNSGKIRSEMGWSPSTQFKDGLSHTIKWYLDKYCSSSGI